MAQEIYNEFCDMDYESEQEHDLQFISALIDVLGVEDTRRFLAHYFE